MKEIWKDIPNYEGLYLVSNKGNVISLPRKGMQSKTPKLLKKHKNNCNYDMVTLCKSNKIKALFIHRLVAQTFIDNPNNYPCINHKNGDKSNNCVNNLEWCSYSYNMLHAYRTKLKIPTNYYIKNGLVKPKN